MVWAATKTTTGTSTDWDTATAWTPSGEPGVDDYVQINHAITLIYSLTQTCAGLYIDNAILSFGTHSSLTLKDAAGTHASGAHILVSSDADSGINSIGTSTYPVTVQSASASPSYRIKFQIADVTTAETRTLDFSYMRFDGAACFLGNDTRYIWFNTGDVTNDGVVTQPDPIHRAQKITAHYVEGRAYGRVYRDGGNAGTIDISGLVPWLSYDWQTMMDMRDNGDKVAFQGQFVVMPSARIESLRFGQRAGPYVPFTLTLIEDI